MYLDYYHLRKDPFHCSPDPDFIFLSTSHLEALAAITFGVVQRKGFIVVLGEEGLGKTTLIQSVINDLEVTELEIKKTRIIRFFDSRVSFFQLLRTTCLELGLTPKSDEEAGLLNQLNRTLTEEYTQGNNVVFLVDEAQDMPVETLEGLRLVSNLETPSEKIIQIVLVGQPELWNTLGRHELRQLKQRVTTRINLSPLSRAESRDYIKLRIEKAGARPDSIFTRRVLKKIIHQAEGYPAKINQLGHQALKVGYEQLQKPVSEKVIKLVIGTPKGARKWKIGPWAVPSPTALLIAGGLSGLVILLFFLGPRMNLFSPLKMKPGEPAALVAGKGKVPVSPAITSPQETAASLLDLGGPTLAGKQPGLSQAELADGKKGIPPQKKNEP